MTHKVIDDMDLNFYPLQPNMPLEDIKAITRAAILDGAKIITTAIKKSYKGTPYTVDMERARLHLGLLTTLKHTGGALAEVPFRLLPFQVEFVIQSLCVVYRDTGLRKHREATMFIPRKNGKTELGAALNLVMLFQDKEKQKEIYSIASETQQAAILYKACVSMMKQSPRLSKLVKQYKAEKKLEYDHDGILDEYKVLSAIAGTKDGLKTSTLFADEPHSYPDSALFDVVQEGSAHRLEPITFLLSTAGYNKQGFFHRKLNYAKQVMDGTLDNPSIYLMDFSLDDEEDWENSDGWKDCNPALGFGVNMGYLNDKFHKAQHSASDEVSFKTKHLNLWVDAAITWIRSKDWITSNQLEFTEKDLYGRECYIGLDLSSTTDLTTYVLSFPNDKGGYEVLTRTFIPKDNAVKRSKEDKVSYLQWEKEGFMTLTPGNIIDYEEIYRHIMTDVGKFDVRELSFDRWNATALITKLTEQGVECVGFGQGYKSMSPAVKSVEALVLQQKLNHGNNPVLSWCVANVAIEVDAAENMKIDKSKAVERVDCAVALAMSIGRAESFREQEADWESLIGGFTLLICSYAYQLQDYSQMLS